MKILTEAEQKMLDELREKAQTVLDYMQRNGMMHFHRVGLDVTPDYNGAPHITVDVTTEKGRERRIASMYQFLFQDTEWTTNITEWKGEEE